MTKKTRKDKKRKKQVSRILVFLFVLTVYVVVFPHTVGIEGLSLFADICTSSPLAAHLISTPRLLAEEFSHAEITT